MKFDILLADAEDGSSLQIYIDSGWEHRVDSTDKGYLAALIEDWRHISSERITDMIHELCRVSHGPISLVRDKHASFAEAISLLDKNQLKQIF